MSTPTDEVCANAMGALCAVLNEMTISGWVFLALALVVGFVFILVTWKRWDGFAVRFKWASRTILFLLTLVLAAFIHGVGAWAFQKIPVELAFESPHLTATAIKIGLYSLGIQQEEKKILPTQDALLLCVYNLSYADARNHANSCGNDQACIEFLPTLSRQEIIAKIKESQEKEILPVTGACKGIDVSKL